MSYRKFQVYFFVTLLVLSATMTLLVFRSYLTLLAFGGVLAVLARTPYMYLKKKLKSETAAAFTVVLGIGLVMLIPVAFFLATLSAELISLVASSKDMFGAEQMNDFLLRVLPVSFHDQIPAVMDESLKLVRTVVEAMSTNLFNILSNLFGMFFGFIVILISTYYLLKDGGKVKKELLVLSPLGDDQDELVFKRVFTAVEAVMGGVLVMSLLKGVLAGISFWVFGIPAPLFWGTMTGFASFIPLVGSALITIPAVIYLFIIGEVGAAVGLMIFAVAVIGTVDNFLQPKLVQSRTKIHPLLILLSILGGLQFYGFSGFILGPLTLAVTMALIDIYKREFRNFIERASSS